MKSVGLLLVSSILVPVAWGNLITNGSFETPTFNGSGLFTLGLVGSAVTGWSIPTTDGTYPWGLQNGAFGASTPYGNQFFVLGRTSTGTDFTIEQTITGLTPGNTYSLSFAIASEEGCCAAVEVSFPSGSSTGAQDFTALTSGTFWTQWSTQQENFLATSSSVTLQFKDLAAEFPNGLDLGLDNVDVEGAVSGVPEPTSAVLVGFSLAALAVLKRRAG